MSLVLGAQLYLTYRVEEDLLEEIEGFSNSINLATDSYYSSILEDIQEVEKKIHGGLNLPLQDTICFFPELQTTRDSLYVKIITELKNLQGINQYNPHIIVDRANDLDHIDSFDHKDIAEFKEKVENKAHSVKKFKISRSERFRREQIPPPLLNLPKSEVYKKYPKSVAKPYPIMFETVDINLNDVNSLHRRPFPVFPKPEDFKRRSRHQKNFIIRIPDFSLPNSPKILRYNYSSEKIEKAFINSRNKNILITGSLFLVFIFAVSLISKRYLKPIGVLSKSFESVESGNLDVTVLNKSKDEIGNLTRSFNHMVSEMRKNREKEKVLKRKEHLASMGQLAAGVAHEIKNPLNAINLTIDHLKDKYADEDETFQKYVFTIQNEILFSSNLLAA